MNSMTTDVPRVCFHVIVLFVMWTISCSFSPLSLSPPFSNLPNPSGLTVESYGTGTQVRLPGKSSMEPRIFKFGTPYAEMYRSLAATPEDEAFFLHNGVLQLCKRGSSVKVCTLHFCYLAYRSIFSCQLFFVVDCQLPIISFFTTDGLDCFNSLPHSDGKIHRPRLYRNMMW